LLSGATALFLDFDGTLAPLAPRPQDVHTPRWVVPTLARLRAALGGALAMLSGRPLAQLDAFLRPLRLPAAGVHGAERRLVDGRVRRHDPALPARLRATAQALAEHNASLLIEGKPGGLALHYRASPELETLCESALRDAIDGEDEWDLLPGHCVIEVKPRSICKGTALRAFMVEPEFAGRVPVVVGDDVGDESAVIAAQAAGGFGVRVGRGESCARYRLSHPRAVQRWLGACADALEDRLVPERPAA
jgi:trehalose 6-phosphate phosphatase